MRFFTYNKSGDYFHLYFMMPGAKGILTLSSLFRFRDINDLRKLGHLEYIGHVPAHINQLEFPFTHLLTSLDHRPKSRRRDVLHICEVQYQDQILLPAFRNHLGNGRVHFTRRKGIDISRNINGTDTVFYLCSYFHFKPPNQLNPFL